MLAGSGTFDGVGEESAVPYWKNALVIEFNSKLSKERNGGGDREPSFLILSGPNKSAFTSRALAGQVPNSAVAAHS